MNWCPLRFRRGGVELHAGGGAHAALRSFTGARPGPAGQDGIKL